MWLACEKANLGSSKALPLKYSVAALCVLSLGIPWLPEASFWHSLLLKAFIYHEHLRNLTVADGLEDESGVSQVPHEPLLSQPGRGTGGA